MGALYLLTPQRFTVRYWRTTLVGPRGQLWFVAPTRAALDDVVSLAGAVRAAIAATGRRAAALGALLATAPS